MKIYIKRVYNNMNMTTQNNSKRKSKEHPPAYVHVTFNPKVFDLKQLLQGSCLEFYGTHYEDKINKTKTKKEMVFMFEGKSAAHVQNAKEFFELWNNSPAVLNMEIEGF